MPSPRAIVDVPWRIVQEKEGCALAVAAKTINDTNSAEYTEANFLNDVITSSV